MREWHESSELDQYRVSFVRTGDYRQKTSGVSFKVGYVGLQTMRTAQFFLVQFKYMWMYLDVTRSKSSLIRVPRVGKRFSVMFMHLAASALEVLIDLRAVRFFNLCGPCVGLLRHLKPQGPNIGHQ